MRTVPTPLLLAALLLATFLGCAGTSWEQVRSEDTPAAYRRYLEDHPRSSHAQEARQRIAVLQVERKLTPEAVERFREAHPESSALPELESRLEKKSFDAARAAATPEAYEQFLATNPDEEFAARARGNAAFLRAGGFSADPEALGAFLREHPTSDYATEARRSLLAIEASRTQRFGAVGLRIEIAPGVGEADRLRKVFEDRARETYAAAGIPLSRSASGAWLTISHAEQPASAQDESGRLATPGVVARTEVTLTRDGNEQPVFRERFSQRVSKSELRTGGSALFSRAAAPYWDRFYVPVASWSTQFTRRAVWRGDTALVAAAGEPGRALALAPNGSFRDLDLSDPAETRIVASYQRSGTLARYSGARRIGDRVALFGEDGVEIVERDGSSYTRVVAYDRGAVGAVSGLVEVDGRLLVAGTQGLVRISPAGGPVERLIERPLRGIALQGDRLLLMDSQWLYAGSAHNPQPTGFFTAADLGRAMDPEILRVSGSLAVVVGERGVVCLDVRRDQPARRLARPRVPAVGVVTDAAVIGRSVFLLGERGLQVLDPASGRVLDAVDVGGRRALGASGGHLVAVGENHLEIVDASPWLVRSVPASPAH